MLIATMILLAGLTSVESTIDKDNAGIQSMILDESPDVFLAKATLQQYLSREVRKDWDGVKRLTHPKALSTIAAMKKRTGSETHSLAPWANQKDQLKTFRFGGAKEVAPGVVILSAYEDNFHKDQQGMSTDDPAVYILFKAHGGFVIGDKRPGVELGEVSAESVRAGYPGWMDAQSKAQARAEVRSGKHR